MQITLFIMQILILLSLVIISLFLKGHLPACMKKKGENLATKEDIGIITDKIESIRSIYLSELEKIKSTLKISVEQESRLNKNRHDSVMAFLEASYVIHDYLVSLPMIIVMPYATDIAMVIRVICDYQQSIITAKGNLRTSFIKTHYFSITHLI
jgi:hypothetical protein